MPIPHSAMPTAASLRSPRNTSGAEAAVDRVLRHGVLAGALARVDEMRPVWGQRDDARLQRDVEATQAARPPQS